MRGSCCVSLCELPGRGMLDVRDLGQIMAYPMYYNVQWLLKKADDTMVACAPLTLAARVQGPVQERLVEICSSPFNIEHCISHGLHDHVTDDAVSLTLSGT